MKFILKNKFSQLILPGKSCDISFRIIYKQKGSYIESIPEYVEEVKNSTVNFSVTSTKIITKKPKLAVKVKNVEGNQ